MSVAELFVAVVVIAALVITTRLSFHIVRSGEVQLLLRFGQYRRMLRSGVHFILPIATEFFPVSIRKQRSVVRVPAFTAEGIAVALDVQIVYRVVDPPTYASQLNAAAGLDRTAVSAVRQEVAGFPLGQLRKAIETAEQYFRSAIGERLAILGIEVDEASVSAMHLPPELQLIGVVDALGDTSAQTVEYLRVRAAREIGRRSQSLVGLPPPFATSSPAARR